jgi:hypothetical protein
MGAECSLSLSYIGGIGKRIVVQGQPEQKTQDST